MKIILVVLIFICVFVVMESYSTDEVGMDCFIYAPLEYYHCGPCESYMGCWEEGFRIYPRVHCGVAWYNTPWDYCIDGIPDPHGIKVWQCQTRIRTDVATQILLGYFTCATSCIGLISLPNGSVNPDHVMYASDIISCYNCLTGYDPDICEAISMCIDEYDNYYWEPIANGACAMHN